MEGYTTVTETDTLAKKLRLELKEWEQSFAAAHQGRTAGREDIKQHPEIAHKYKLYDRLRRPSSKRRVSHNATPSKKQSATNPYPVPSSHSPSKRQKHAHPVHLAATCFHDPLSPRYLSPRTLRTSIGPTPQKDGQVLGLFDQLSAAAGSQTPSKRKALHLGGGNILATPSKRPRSNDRIDTENLHQISLNGSKGKFMNEILTPSTRRTMHCSTPASRMAASKQSTDETPAFLKRDSQRANVEQENIFGDEEEGVSWSPVAIRKTPKAAGRGLSALVRGLREMEDEVLDEELDMLREIESESAPRNYLDQRKILVEDSQRHDMPLGPDGCLGNDEDGVEYADEGKGRDGKPLKLWKKKGQKRTTRRVHIKPNTAKWKPEPAWQVGQANGDEENGVVETQTPSADRSTEFGCASDEYEDREVIQGATGAVNGRKHAIKNKLEQEKGLPKKVKKVKKKISATAHANFRALKIKNKKSKVKKGGKFGRKR